jgi:DNA-binding MarR family transcriptional regulator
VVRWDEAEGTVLEAKHPESVEISPDEMMRIFTSHAMGEGKPGFLAMKLGALNIASYYTGLALRGMPQYYVAVLLTEDEDATIFEEPLTENSTELLQKVGSDNFPVFLEEIYKGLTDYLTLTDEQKMALLVKDERRRLLLRKLTGGPASKIEAKELLEQEMKKEILNMDLLVEPLVKLGIVRKAIVEGIPSECLFLLKDIFPVRLPPDTLVMKALRNRMSEALASKYESQITKFFSSYKVLEEDFDTVTSVLTNPAQYKLTQALRSNVLTMRELAQQTGLSEPTVKEATKALQKNDVVSEISDRSGNRYLALKCNPTFLAFYPEYMVNVMRSKWASGMLEDGIAKKHLELLKEAYYTI